MTPWFINYSRHVSGQYKHRTDLATQICKCQFANRVIIEDFTDITHNTVQRFDSVVVPKPATALLYECCGDFNFIFISCQISVNFNCSFTQLSILKYSKETVVLI